jgi:hypothetical protein
MDAAIADKLSPLSLCKKEKGYPEYLTPCSRLRHPAAERTALIKQRVPIRRWQL